MNRLSGLALCAVLGCSGFPPPTPDQLRSLGILPPERSPEKPPTLRIRFRMNVEGRWLAGLFDGVAVGTRGSAPIIRAQLFGDVGPKIVDLLAAPDRIRGFFPQTREALQCPLPDGAFPHPLVFMGVSLLEQFAPVTEDRVLGLRPEAGGWTARLRPTVPGVDLFVRYGPDGRLNGRRYGWMYGVRWDEAWLSENACVITASNLSIRLDLQQVKTVPATPGFFDLPLPDDATWIKGSTK